MQSEQSQSKLNLIFRNMSRSSSSLSIQMCSVLVVAVILVSFVSDGNATNLEDELRITYEQKFAIDKVSLQSSDYHHRDH